MLTIRIKLTKFAPPGLRIRSAFHKRNAGAFRDRVVLLGRQLRGREGFEASAAEVFAGVKELREAESRGLIWFQGPGGAPYTLDEVMAEMPQETIDTPISLENWEEELTREVEEFRSEDTDHIPTVPNVPSVDLPPISVEEDELQLVESIAVGADLKLAEEQTVTVTLVEDLPQTINLFVPVEHARAAEMVDEAVTEEADPDAEFDAELPSTPVPGGPIVLDVDFDEERDTIPMEVPVVVDPRKTMISEELKSAQLKSICEFLDLKPRSKKADMVADIHRALDAGAELTVEDITSLVE